MTVCSMRGTCSIFTGPTCNTTSDWSFCSSLPRSAPTCGDLLRGLALGQALARARELFRELLKLRVGLEPPLLGGEGVLGAPVLEVAELVLEELPRAA